MFLPRPLLGRAKQICKLPPEQEESGTADSPYWWDYPYGYGPFDYGH